MGAWLFSMHGAAHASVTCLSFAGNIVLKFLLVGGVIGSILTVHANNKSGIALPTFAVFAFFQPETPHAFNSLHALHSDITQ